MVLKSSPNNYMNKIVLGNIVTMRHILQVEDLFGAPFSYVPRIGHFPGFKYQRIYH